MSTWETGDLEVWAEWAKEMRQAIDACVPQIRAVAETFEALDARIALLEERIETKERLCARQAEMLMQAAARLLEAPAAAAA